MPAGLATSQRGGRLMQGIDDILTEAGIEHSVHGVPSMFGFFIKPHGKMQDYRDVAKADYETFEKLANAMRERGVEYENDPREPLFMCAAHTDKDVDDTLNALNDSVKLIK